MSDHEIADINRFSSIKLYDSAYESKIMSPNCVFLSISEVIIETDDEIFHSTVFEPNVKQTDQIEESKSGVLSPKLSKTAKDVLDKTDTESMYSITSIPK